MKNLKNCTSIPDSEIEKILNELDLKLPFKTIISEDVSLEKMGDVRFNFQERICFIFLKNEFDISTLAHELRHVWQMVEMSPEVHEMIYAIEQEQEGYSNNILEIDAFEWEDEFSKKK